MGLGEAECITWGLRRAVWLPVGEVRSSDLQDMLLLSAFSGNLP